ncbi:hairy and enhancer of split-related protein HELT [Coturnix japonica]|uniref:Hairy and enhancer of split-related protein HELT n=1 Tax=Coturnix japonica TaxID=93934 RepID=A0A8C2Y9X2_COTJA|nr:hairy and enhancer of split-related protein HELT [Coturnix japonica]
MASGLKERRGSAGPPAPRATRVPAAARDAPPASHRTPVSHKVIEKRRRDRINRCLAELGRTVPLALAKQGSGKLEKAEILEMTVQYLRALHSADFPRGREKELLSEFANYFHYGYHECMKNLVHYLTTVERMETKDTKYARILAFLQSKARFAAEPLLAAPPEPDASFPPPPERPPCPAEPFPWPYAPLPAPAALGGPGQQRAAFLPSAQGLERRYLGLLGPPPPGAFGLPPGQHPPAVL